MAKKVAKKTAKKATSKSKKTVKKSPKVAKKAVKTVKKTAKKTVKKAATTTKATTPEAQTKPAPRPKVSMGRRLIIHFILTFFVALLIFGLTGIQSDLNLVVLGELVITSVVFAIPMTLGVLIAAAVTTKVDRVVKELLTFIIWFVFGNTFTILLMMAQKGTNQTPVLVLFIISVAVIVANYVLRHVYKRLD